MAIGVINAVSRAAEFGSGLGSKRCGRWEGKSAYRSLTKCYLSIN